MDCSMQDFPILHCLLELVQIQLSQWCYLTISSSAAPSSFWLTLSQHQVFSNELTLHIRWPKYWIFSFSMSPSSEYSGLISFRIDWFNLLAVQGTLKSLLQHHSLKASILQCSSFFMVQLSYSYMTAGKTIAYWHMVGFHKCSFSFLSSELKWCTFMILILTFTSFLPG